MRMYRPLEKTEITALAEAGNRADDWGNVLVTEDFVTDNIRDCRFSGRVRIGRIDGQAVSPSGVKVGAALKGCYFIDCTIGDGAAVCNIGSHIANYDIGAGAYVVNCGTIETTGQSSFGNGTMAAVVNEAGGREVPLTDVLTSQTAYITAMYRHHPELTEGLYALSDDYARSAASERGTIGGGAKISGCGVLRNVRVGDHATVSGAAELVNGTVGRSSYTGVGVVARNFIFAEGAQVDTGAIAERCFVGENAHLESGFSAVDSLFFAGSHCANGEACSIFAGPFTVSHHRSSLLIAGIFSFFNAGSGANQSNHLFKTGPVHQGVHERGCKFASNAYVMLPAREGAFTMVLGRHSSHHDTRDFPFSYLIEEDGKSFLMPGANLRCHGTVRDMAKWPVRDRRNGPKRDQISFEVYNPFLGGRVARAIERSEKLMEKDSDIYSVDRIRIRRPMLTRGFDLYKKFYDATLAHILSTPGEADEAGAGEWVDVGGMYAPRGVIDGLCGRIADGAIKSLDALTEEFAAIHSRYGAYARGWALSRLAGGDMGECLSRGAEAAEAIRRMTDDDALRDAAKPMMVGYGIDAPDESESLADFGAVRK